MTGPRLSKAVPTLILTARGSAIATLAAALLLFVSAGIKVQVGIPARSETGLDVHGVAAILIHITTGLLAVALIGLSLATARHRLVAVVASAVFLYTFVQAILGNWATLAAHIAGSLAVVIGSVWLAAWLFIHPGIVAAQREPLDSPERRLE